METTTSKCTDRVVRHPEKYFLRVRLRTRIEPASTHEQILSGEEYMSMTTYDYHYERLT